MSVWLLLAASLGLAAEPAPVKALVGQELTLTLDSLPAGTSDFAVVKAEKKDGRWAVTLLPLAAGRLEFHGVPLTVEEPPLPEDAGIADIAPPLRARPALWPWLLAALLGAAAWHARREWLRRRAQGGPEAPAAPPVPLERRAEAALDELEASGLWQRGEHAAFYLRLTGILRGYLEERWGEPATAMSSGELARLVKSRARLELAATARELLERADLVKFARLRAAEGDGPGDLERARRLVRETTPVPEPAGAAR